VLLMDEPFGALDAQTREVMHDLILHVFHLERATVVFVTHDVEEALALADYLAIMDAGRVLQYGTPLEIMVRPASEFVAALIGANEIMRLLGLVDVGSVMEPATTAAAAAAQPLRESDRVSDALTRLLRSPTDVLPVVDRSGAVVGQCSLAGIRDRLRSVRVARREMAEAQA
jgi:osmoprotectant transport system ATP-binding protein